ALGAPRAGLEHEALRVDLVEPRLRLVVELVRRREAPAARGRAAEVARRDRDADLVAGRAPRAERLREARLGVREPAAIRRDLRDVVHASRDVDDEAGFADRK